MKIFRLISLLFLAALFSTVCCAQTPEEDLLTQKLSLNQYETQVLVSYENHTLKIAAGTITRLVDYLRIQLENGKIEEFLDDSCASDGWSGCHIFRAIAYYPSIKFVIIMKTNGEGNLFILLNLRNGKKYEFRSFPILTRNGQHVILVNSNDMTGMRSIEIWGLFPRFILEKKEDPAQPLPPPLVVNYLFNGWKSDRMAEIKEIISDPSSTGLEHKDKIKLFYVSIQ